MVDNEIINIIINYTDIVVYKKWKIFEFRFNDNIDKRVLIYVTS